MYTRYINILIIKKYSYIYLLQIMNIPNKNACKTI